MLESERMAVAVELRRAKCGCCGAPHQDEIQKLRALRELLVGFCVKERALHDAQGKGGQSVGYSPSISPSVLKELERMLRDSQ